MPFLAILYVRDAETANRLREQYQQDARSLGGLVGIYRFPTKDEKLCECVNEKSWTRSGKHGHMVHSQCARRNRRWWNFLKGSLFDLLGKNLLPRRLTPRQFRNPEGWD